MNTHGCDNFKVVYNPPHLKKEHKMLVLTGYEDGLTAVGESIESTIAEAFGRRIKPEMTPPMLHEIASLPPARMVKIFEVSYKLAQGTYDLDERLDAVLDRLLEDITA
jgi:hypothetical protein